MVVITALQVEYEAMLQHLEDPSTVELPSGTLVELGRLPGIGWDVALIETGPTNTRAGLLAQSAVEHFGADAVFFVGVAGTLKNDVRLGDVVVGSKIYGYHGGRESADGFSARPDVLEPPHRVDQLVRSARRKEPWCFLLPKMTSGPEPRVHFAPLASGDVLIGSRDSETVRRIRSHYDDAVAVDMESYGVASAARLHGETRMLAVRGISDFADPGKAAADAEGSQQTAARNAAAFALRVLRDLPPSAATPARSSQRSAPILVSGHDKGSDAASWDSCPVITVEGQEYLLYEGSGDLLQESRDREVVRRQAVARVLSSGQAAPVSYVWLRQVAWERQPPALAVCPLDALEQEARLCRDIREPRVVQLSRHKDTVTLALAWPADRRRGNPAETLHELLPGRPSPADPLRLWSIVRGLAQVTEVLEKLHMAGHSHRALRPTALVMGRPKVQLRDFGLATVPPRRGENPGISQAPEQQHGSTAEPGPATDVYQVCALVQQALTGRPPVPGLPVQRPTDAAPEQLAQLVGEGLGQAPSARPGVRELRLALTAAADELSVIPSQH